MIYTIESLDVTCGGTMSDLGLYIEKQIRDRKWTWRAAEEATGVSKTALVNLVEKEGIVPELETLARLSRAFNMPLWRVVEMAGFDLGFTDRTRPAMERLASLVEAMPQYRLIVDQLLAAQPDDLEGVLTFLEGARARRGYLGQE